MSKSKFGIIALVTVLLLSLSVSLVAAQYATEKTTNVTIGSDGTFAASEADVGVSYEIIGTPGATGTVTAAVYSGNPQAGASVPSDVSLAHFVVITFDINADDFTSATVTLSYTDSMVQNIHSPFAVYKYDAGTDSYVALASTVDTVAKTITVTLNSVDDPLFAIGGATGAAASGGGISASLWAIIIISTIAVVLLSVFVVSHYRDAAAAKKAVFSL